MYNDENDYELLYLIKEENEDAKEMFFEKYKPIVEIKANKIYNLYPNYGYDINDLIQEGMLALNEAINTYSEEKDVKFNTYANVVIERHLLSFVRKFSSQKHKLLNSSVSIDAENNEGRILLEILNDNSTNPEHSFITEEEQRELKEKMKERLTDREREVFDLRFEGFSYQEISRLLNISVKSVDGTISRIKQKLEKVKKDID